jgi:rRNA pseudouridine-1189 N-methylase Emg1 (Nep1/Mra1 family)
MAALVVDKHDGSVLKEAFSKRMPKDWRRFRSCMVKILDNWYFKELPQAEFERQIADNVT